MEKCSGKNKSHKYFRNLYLIFINYNNLKIQRPNKTKTSMVDKTKTTLAV